MFVGLDSPGGGFCGFTPAVGCVLLWVCVVQFCLCSVLLAVWFWLRRLQFVVLAALWFLAFWFWLLCYGFSLFRFGMTLICLIFYVFILVG